MSKFIEIFHDIESKILNGTYQSGDFLPGELQLKEDYQVSRETVRKALTLLANHGLIQKIHGRGSKVLDRKKYDFPISGLTSYKELIENLGIENQTQLIENQVVNLPDHVALALDLPTYTQAHYVVRVRSVEGERVILDEDYILADIVKSIPDAQAEHSLYHYFEKDLNLQIAYARKEFNVNPVRPIDKNLLDLHQDKHVVLVQSQVFLEDTRPFQYTESRHRLDKFRFVDFARRKIISG